jgi:hypothetical protein
VTHDELRALCAQAPAPKDVSGVYKHDERFSHKGSRFYDAAREAVPALLDENARLRAALAEAEADREALMEGLGLDPSPEALAEQREQFSTEGIVWRWRDEIAIKEIGRLRQLLIPLAAPDCSVPPDLADCEVVVIEVTVADVRAARAALGGEATDGR